MAKLKDFINNFDFNKSDWLHLPNGFPKCDLNGLTSEEIGKFTSIRSLWELSRPEKPKSRSRVWHDPKGYQYLGVWQNAALLRVLVRVFTKGLPRREYRLKAQMDDEARSTKRNTPVVRSPLPRSTSSRRGVATTGQVEEGWKRPTTSEYLQFLGYSQASLEELRGDIRDCKTDGFLKSVPGSSLKNKGINLRVTKGPRKGQVKGEPTDSSHPYYQPLKILDPKSLTYEEFMELVNKTDYLLRRLVESLERKLTQEQKHYQVEQARIKSKIRK